jgi:hypothetical protein
MTTPTTVIVDIDTFNDFVGDDCDRAIVALTDPLRERVRALHGAVSSVAANYIEEFNASPTFLFLNRETRIDLINLVVAADGDFWWQGHLKNTGIRWQTGRIPAALLTAADAGIVDLREHKADPLDEPAEDAMRFLNRYRHCETDWEDAWSCACNDRCPVCDAEIEPYESVDLESEARGCSPTLAEAAHDA